MKWISVKDRLPEEYGEPVIGCVEDRYSLTGLVTVSMVCYIGEWHDLCGEESEEDSVEVKYWMPWPEPPRGKRYER
jgi:hypothetical protein